MEAVLEPIAVVVPAVAAAVEDAAAPDATATEELHEMAEPGLAFLVVALRLAHPQMSNQTRWAAQY